MSFISNAKHAFMGGFDDDREYEDTRAERDREYEDDLDERPRRSFFSFLSRNTHDEYEDTEEETEEEPTARSRFARYERAERAERPERAERAERTERRTGRSSGYGTRERTGYAARESSGYDRGLSGVDVTVFKPHSFDDSIQLVKEVKANKVTLFDVSEITSNEDARRMVDYICGAAEGMECVFDRIFPTIFMFAPKGVNLKKRNG